MFKQIQGVEVIRQWRDETKACHRRDLLGLAGSLVSWLAQEDGSWLARLSGPGLVETVEATGKTRVDAIRKAESEFARQATASLNALPNLRART